MSDTEVNWEMLNAYVDGELDAPARANVARAVANDSELAQQVAMLTQLKSATLDSVDAPELTVPTARRPSFIPKALAAGIALLLMIGGGMWFGIGDQAPELAWYAPLKAYHQNWVKMDVLPGSIKSSTLKQVGWSDDLTEPYVPDLSAAKLTLTHFSLIKLSGARQGLLVGYQGTRGCRVSLIVVPGENNLGPEPAKLDGQEHAVAWQVGGLGYVLIADGMDLGRFDQIALAVHDMSLKFTPAPTETQVALAESRRDSPPCVG